MLPLTFKFIGPHDEAPWSEVSQDDVSNQPPEIVVLERGTANGLPSVAIKILTRDGKPVVVQTTARLYCMVARAIMARYPNLFDGID